MNKSLRLIFWVLVFASCIQSPKKPSADTQSASQYENGLEVGRWIYKGSDGSIVEEGDFDKGIRVGMWRYSLPAKDSIVWNKFLNVSGNILTNVPSFLVVKEDSDSTAYFEYSDSAKIFKAAVSVQNCGNILTLDQYEKQLYNDLANRKFKIFDTLTQKIETVPGHQYLYHKFFGTREDLKNVRIFTIAEIKNNKIYEVSVWSEPEFSNRAQIVFFSILPNLFLSNSRFINQKDVISSIK